MAGGEAVPSTNHPLHWHIALKKNFFYFILEYNTCSIRSTDHKCSMLSQTAHSHNQYPEQETELSQPPEAPDGTFRSLSLPQADVPSQLLRAQTSFSHSRPLYKWNIPCAIFGAWLFCALWLRSMTVFMERQITHPHRAQHSTVRENTASFSILQ